MMKRSLSLLLVVGLIAVLAVPVSAAEGGGWLELLEFTSVQADGDNWFNVDGKSGTTSIALPTEMRLAKIDLIITHTTADPVTAVSVTNGSSKQSLSIVRIDNTTSRAYGNIPTGFYKSIDLTVTKTGTAKASLAVLSCKVSSLNSIDNPAHGTLRRSYNDSSPITLPGDFSVASDGSENMYEYKLIPVTITDWQKYDYITLFGSISKMALNSFRASIGSKGLPYEITYMESIPTGETIDFGFRYDYVSETETNYYDDYSLPDEYSVEDGLAVGSNWGNTTCVYGGSVLFTVTIDLTGIDRTVGGTMDCYFTCIANPGLGYAFNVQNASGCIVTADTTSVSWWNRFTSFMTDLFGPKDDSGVLDDLGSSSDSISQNTSQISDFEHSQQSVLDNNFAQIQTAVTFTNFAAALVFVQKYANMTFSGISGYAIVFTLPLFLGLFFYLCSRIPGITRWKTPPPRSKPKGGGKP